MAKYEAAILWLGSVRGSRDDASDQERHGGRDAVIIPRASDTGFTTRLSRKDRECSLGTPRCARTPT